MGRVKCSYTLPNGETVELFFIGRLAAALGREANTIRKWEIAGILPSTCFRDRLGDRLYTAEQIEAVVKIAEQCKLMQGRRMCDTLFTKRVTAAFKELEEKYKGGKLNE